MPLAAVGAVAGCVAAAASAASVGYQIYQGGGSGGSGVYGSNYGSTVTQTPQEQAFFQMQTLLNEQTANANAQASVETANSAYEAAQTSNAWFKYAMTGGAILAALLLLRKKKIL